FAIKVTAEDGGLQYARGRRLTMQWNRIRENCTACPDYLHRDPGLRGGRRSNLLSYPDCMAL
ncbi:hypothetical protein, partial [Marinilabilia salmonicolor]|uniref:hypothetical protein n=1 Tax=Marinilabilia salmonicolor TaxID=989 RepID=UPI001EE68916